MSSKFLVAAALLAFSAAPLPAQSVSAGVEAWQRSDYAGAVSIWRPLAENGNPEAEFNLGQAYRLGRGVPTNLAAAKTWFERAATSGSVDAQTTLGLLLFQNGEQAAGLKWLRKAADQAEPRAMLVYGTALFNGDGVPQDPARGYAYVSRSASTGLAPARQTLEQLEPRLPPADRKRGIAIAHDLATSAGKAEATAGKVALTPVATAAAKTPPKAAAKAARKVAAAAGPPITAVAKQKPEAVAAAPASGHWRIQLGAFSNRRNAEALYKRLSAKSTLAGREPFYVAAGAVTRLQVGPFESKASAQAACNAAGVACFPVPAK